MVNTEGLSTPNLKELLLSAQQPALCPAYSDPEPLSTLPTALLSQALSQSWSVCHVARLGTKPPWGLSAEREGLSSVPGPLEAKPRSHLASHHGGHMTDPHVPRAERYQTVY